MHQFVSINIEKLIGLRFPDAKFADILLRVTNKKHPLSRGFLFVTQVRENWNQIVGNIRVFKKLTGQNERIEVM